VLDIAEGRVLGASGCPQWALHSRTLGLELFETVAAKNFFEALIDELGVGHCRASAQCGYGFVRPRLELLIQSPIGQGFDAADEHAGDRCDVSKRQPGLRALLQASYVSLRNRFVMLK